MSREGCTPLGDYIRALVDTLADDAPALHERLRTVVGSRAARIGLDTEAVVVRFAGGDLHVDEPGMLPVDGEGHTDTATVRDILGGRLEVGDAILAGRLDVRGSPDAVERMFVAVEILLDAAARSPRLQAVAARFLADPCHGPGPAATGGEDGFTPGAVSAAERALLARLGLLTDR